MSILAPARAAASRRNGAKSRGPKTAEGKARSAQNALKHGLRAQKFVVLPGESAAEFEALETALLEELAPEGSLQSVLAQRVVAATWRLARADCLAAGTGWGPVPQPGGQEADVFEVEGVPGRSLGLALIRDCNGARSFDTLLRYRGGTLAEFWRALRTLKALQAAQAARPEPAAAPRRIAIAHETPIEPESRGDPGLIGPAPAADPEPASAQRGAAVAAPIARCPRPALERELSSTPAADPNEPEARTNPAIIAPMPAAARPALRLHAAVPGDAVAPAPAPRAGPAGAAGGLRLSRIPDRP